MPRLNPSKKDNTQREQERDMSGANTSTEVSKPDLYPLEIAQTKMEELRKEVYKQHPDMEREDVFIPSKSNNLRYAGDLVLLKKIILDRIITTKEGREPSYKHNFTRVKQIYLIRKYRGQVHFLKKDEYDRLRGNYRTALNRFKRDKFIDIYDNKIILLYEKVDEMRELHDQYSKLWEEMK